VIQTNQPSIMRWENWTRRQRGDAVWQQEVIDTGRLTLEELAAEIAKWIRKKLGG
jgi:hypothetical protein